MKYIDAEKLKELINERWKELADKGVKVGGGKYESEIYTYLSVLGLIDYLQNEQSDDVVTMAKAFLDALSKTPYNNKPITDAQIIVKQLLLFFENPKEYNPDAILEQPEADLEKEINNCFPKSYFENGVRVNFDDVVDMAHHFYELGLRTHIPVIYKPIETDVYKLGLKAHKG